MRTILVGFTSSAVALAAASAAAAAAAFVTPTKAAYCGVSEGEPPLQLICWRPRDGLTLSMGRRGKAGKGIDRANRGYHEPARLLPFGRTWRIYGYWRCASRPSGLTCTNRAGHGWWLGRRRGSRLF
jgi:Family of unknown function (DUF6636)